MKYKLTILLVLISFIGAAQTTYDSRNGTAITKGIAMTSGTPSDFRSYYYDAGQFASRKFNSVSEALSYFSSPLSRRGNFPIYIRQGGVTRTYMFRDSTLDASLVLIDNIDVSAGVTSINGLNGVVNFTKNDIGLTNVDNTSDATKNSATATLLNKTLTSPIINGGKLNTSSTTGYVITATDNAGGWTWAPTQAIGGTVTTVNGQSGAVTVDKTSVGLSNADNTSDANKPISTATQTALSAKADASALSSHTSNLSNPHQTTASQVGLGNVNNTSDASKPVSTLQQAALDLKANLASPTFTGTLGGSPTIGNSWVFPSTVTQNAASQTLTNKVINGSNNTLSNIGTLGNSPTSTTVPITLSTGTGTTLPRATSTTAGVMGGDDKKKLDSNYYLVQPIVTGQVIGYSVDAQTLRLKSIVAGTGITVTNTGDSTLTIAATAGLSQAEQTLTDGATITLDCNNGLNTVVTLGGNRTLSITNASAGQYITLRVVQDGIGGRTLTLPSTCKVINTGGGVITLSTAAGAIDIIQFYWNGTNFFTSYGKGFN